MGKLKKFRSASILYKNIVDLANFFKMLDKDGYSRLKSSLSFPALSETWITVFDDLDHRRANGDWEGIWDDRTTCEAIWEGVYNVLLEAFAITQNIDIQRPKFDDVDDQIMFDKSALLWETIEAYNGAADEAPRE